MELSSLSFWLKWQVRSHAYCVASNEISTETGCIPEYGRFDGLLCLLDRSTMLIEETESETT